MMQLKTSPLVGGEPAAASLTTFRPGDNVSVPSNPILPLVSALALGSARSKMVLVPAEVGVVKTLTPLQPVIVAAVADPAVKSAATAAAKCCFLNM
jgi:hypothetical protein